MKIAKTFAVLMTAIVLLSCSSDKRPQQVQQETKEQRDSRMQWWRDARFGMFIHWGPVSLKGTELSWSRDAPRRGIDGVNGGKGEVPVEVYDNLYKEFNPVKFNADEWVSIARAAGMKYMVLTAKHCDGFCLWDSKIDDYSIAQTPFKRDVCGELADAAHSSGMRIGWYYSPMDWRDPDCRTARNADYVKRMQGQIGELLTRYGRIDLMWFDWDGGTIPWDQEATYRLVREAQPEIVVNNRLDCSFGGLSADKDIGPQADYLTPEQVIGAYNDKQPWETCMTLGTQWSWKPGDRIKTVDEVIRILAGCAGGDGNLLLNVGPMPDGRIEPRQVDVLTGVGAWLARHGESIHGTRGGPFKPGRYGASTRRDNKVYLHVFDWPGASIVLPAIQARIVRSSVVGGGRVSVKQTEAGIEVSAPDEGRHSADTVIVLELDRPAAGIPAIEMPAAGPSK
jgi:alpha-L-fucosidase